MIFEREGAGSISNPSVNRISSELKKIKSYGKSSFATLENSEGSYIQIAGGGIGCMLEWRDKIKDRHFRAYIDNPKVPFEDGTRLTFGGGSIPLRKDEWLPIDLVIRVFVAFLDGSDFPSEIHWRDISDMVQPEKNGDAN